MLRIRITCACDADVLVIGAGPAGSAAAFRLASAGLRVILLDRQAFPRDKVCGDFVGPAALAELHRMGITGTPEYRNTNVIRNAALFLDGKKLISRSIPRVQGLPEYGRVIPRFLLDDWLVRSAVHAGVRLLERHKVTGVEVAPDCVRINAEAPDGLRSFTARLAIAADGSNSICAKQVRPGTPRGRIFAVRGYVEGIEGPADQADLYFSRESFPGYYWLFPTGETTANIGLGMVSETVPPNHAHLRNLLVRLMDQDRALHRRLNGAKLTGPITGWPLTTYDPEAPVVAHRLMLAGDAAGLINPLNGEGIQYALASGREAAQVAAACCERNDFSARALSEYARRLDRELGYDMAFARLVIRAISNRSLNPVWLQALRIIVARARLDPDYAHITGGILAGLVPAGDAVSLKVVGGTLEQAAMTAVVRGAVNLVRGPKQWAGLAVSAAGAGFGVAYDAMRDPAGVAKWTLSVAGDAAHLGVRILGHALTDRVRSTEPR